MLTERQCMKLYHHVKVVLHPIIVEKVLKNGEVGKADMSKKEFETWARIRLDNNDMDQLLKCTEVGSIQNALIHLGYPNVMKEHDCHAGEMSGCGTCVLIEKTYDKKTNR